MEEKLTSAERKFLLKKVDEQYQKDCPEYLDKNARFPQNDRRTCGWSTPKKPGQFVAPAGTVMATMMANTKVAEYVNTCNERRGNRVPWLYPNPYNDLYRDPASGRTLSVERLKMYLLYVGLSNVQELRAKMLEEEKKQEPTATTEAASPEPQEPQGSDFAESSAPAITLTTPPPPPTRKTWLWWLVGLLVVVVLLGVGVCRHVNRAPVPGPIFECRAYFWEASDTPEYPDSIWSCAKFRFCNLNTGAYTVEADSLFKLNPGYTSQGRGRFVNQVLEISLDQLDAQGNLHTATILAYFEPAFPVGSQHQPFWGHFLAYSSTLKRITSRPIVFVPTELATPQERQKAKDFLRKLRRDNTWWRHGNDY